MTTYKNVADYLINETKVYVAVNEDRSADGVVLPRTLTWEDGRVYIIDEVKGMRAAANLKAGGAGIRYEVRIGARTTYMFLEKDRWFVERKTV